jgi:hypothetical protein
MQAKALATPDPTLALIRFRTANLLEIGIKMGTIIQEGLDADSADVKTTQKMIGLITTMTVVDRQATRFLQVDQELDPKTARQDSRPRSRIKLEKRKNVT